MKKYLKMIRKGDLLIISILMLGSFLPLGVFSYQQAQAGRSHLQAVIQADGETVKVFDLADDGKTEEFLYRDKRGHENLIVRTGTSIKIAEANCRDQVCVRMNAIEKAGETILCLPHRVLVEVQADGDDALDSGDGIDIIS